MKKLIKILLITLMVIVVAVLALPLWIGPVATTTANIIVPDIVKTPFHLGQFGLNYYAGTLEIGDLQMANPENCGYSEREAVTLGKLRVEYDTASLISDVVHIRLISINDVYVSYVSGSTGKNNFDQIKVNVAGEASSDEVSTEVAADTKIAAEVEIEEDGSKKKFVIDRIEIDNVLVQFGMVPVPIPRIVITNIGNDQDEATFETAINRITTELLKQFTDASLKSGAQLLEVGKQFKGIDKQLKGVEKLGKETFKNLFK